MSIDPPWRLDPRQRIVGVGWGSATIAALAFDVHWSAKADYTDTPTLSYPSIGDDVALLDERPQIPAGIDLTLPQFSSDMLANGLVWAYEPYKHSTQTPGSQTVTVIDQEGYFFTPYGSFGYPYSGVFTVDAQKNNSGGYDPVPGGPYASPYACAAAYFLDYYDGSNLGGDWTGFANSPSGGGYLTSYSAVYGANDQSLITHEETQTWIDYDVVARALIFFNLPKIRQAIAPATVFSFTIATGPASSSQGYDWSASAAIFKGHKDFPATDDLPEWLFGPIAQAGQASNRGPESPLPAYVTTFLIDLTALQITAEKAAA